MSRDEGPPLAGRWSCSGGVMHGLPAARGELLGGITPTPPDSSDGGGARAVPLCLQNQISIRPFRQRHQSTNSPRSDAKTLGATLSDKRSRRRFLADLLFLGGGLTAAGLLARSQLATPEPEPVPAGSVPVPVPASPTPEPVPVPAGAVPVRPHSTTPTIEGKVAPASCPDKTRPAPVRHGPTITGKSAPPRRGE